jgi:hypothetical protein
VSISGSCPEGGFSRLFLRGGDMELSRAKSATCNEKYLIFVIVYVVFLLRRGRCHKGVWHKEVLARRNEKILDNRKIEASFNGKISYPEAKSRLHIVSSIISNIDTFFDNYHDT